MASLPCGVQAWLVPSAAKQPPVNQYNHIRLSIIGIQVNNVDRDNFVVKTVTWNKSLMDCNFVKPENIVYMSTKELCY